jgi:hypothetical protein
MMQFKFNSLRALPYYLVYDGDDDNPDPTASPTPTPTPTPTPNPDPSGADDKNKKQKVSFTKEQQDYINAQLAEERRKGQQKNDQLILQLETIKQRADTTEAERKQIEDRIDQLRGEYATKEELHKKTMETQLKAEKDARAKAEADAKDWKSRFENKMLDVDLIGAAVEHKAYNPHTVKAILQPISRIADELDENGQPTGQFATRVKMQTKTKEGKVQVLDMSPPEAVKFLSEQQEHANLFISTATGGLGGNNMGRGGGGANGKNEPPKDTAEYQEWRKKEKAAGRM